MVYSAVELVWTPYWVVDASAWHGVWAQEDVESIPNDEGERNEEPWDKEWGRGMRVHG